MKYRSSLFVAALMAAASLGCAKKGDIPVENVDLVDDIPARWDDLHQHAAKTLTALKTMPPAQIQGYLRKEWPTLENDIVASLRMADRLPGNRADSVVFHFGSGQGVKADDRTANMHAGFFSDELVAYVYSGRNDPTKVLVRCLNGLLVVEGSELHIVRVYQAEPTLRFTIDRRRGLTSYVDYATSVNLAEHFGLLMYRGKIQTSKHQITLAKARELADSTDRVFVTVKVYEGDTFDLGRMEYTRNMRMARHGKRAVRRRMA